MKWIGITGSWRNSSPELVRDLTREVESELANGNGIVTGGALGVDYIATELALESTPDGRSLKVILPTSLEIYAAHYRKRATEGVITIEQAEALIEQLERVNYLGALITLESTLVNEETYYLRNSAVVAASDEMLAFRVNESMGTQDTVEKARALGLPVRVFEYRV